MHTLHKGERLHRKKVIEQLFAGGARSFAIYPLRVVYLPVEGMDAPVSILISVSKRRFKRAVKRNCLKRRIREVYRTQKHELVQAVDESQQQLAVAFIYLSDKLTDTFVIEKSMKTALARIREKCAISPTG
ncbi:MAG: ribonuclease P protein component [Prevotellaceae bacterium]|jgi:ribonuclease P protein component|nr:ribonuclease P protein component [Prevotellaceae bacterium]